MNVDNTRLAVELSCVLSTEIAEGLLPQIVLKPYNSQDVFWAEFSCTNLIELS